MSAILNSQHRKSLQIANVSTNFSYLRLAITEFTSKDTDIKIGPGRNGPRPLRRVEASPRNSHWGPRFSRKRRKHQENHQCFKHFKTFWLHDDMLVRFEDPSPEWQPGQGIQGTLGRGAAMN